MHHEHVEQQYRERKEIGLRAGNSLASDDLRRHEAWRAVDRAVRLVVNSNVVVVANQDLAGAGIEESVSERDIAVAQTTCVKLQVAMGKLEAGGGESAKAGLDA